MTSNINSNTLTKEQLFACLEYDRIEVSPVTINKAKNNDGQALRDIGYTYYDKKQDYSKVMVWYRLAADQNNARAYNGIGFLYHNEFGAPQDYLTAMEYYLKAARGKLDIAMSNIALLFLCGDGVPLDKYKALEWYIKSGDDPEKVKELNEAGFHIREEDKNKTIYQLANEADDVIREERMERESKLKTEMENLRKEDQQIQQQLVEKDETIALLHKLVQSQANEINLLQRHKQ